MNLIYRRVETCTQTAETALLQEKSQEVWGRTPLYGFEPTVQAYIGKLDEDERGIEFTTAVAHHVINSPLEAKWYLTATPGVELRQLDGEDFACIAAAVKNFQPIIDCE